MRMKFVTVRRRDPDEGAFRPDMAGPYFWLLLEGEVRGRPRQVGGGLNQRERRARGDSRLPAHYDVGTDRARGLRLRSVRRL